MKKSLLLTSFVLLGTLAMAQREVKPTYWTLEYAKHEGHTYVRFYTADHHLVHVERYQGIQLSLNQRTIRFLNKQRERLLASR